MQLEHKSIHRWAYDPFCPIDFRLQDARFLAEGERTKWADEDDPLVLDCAAYLKALNAATTAREPRVSSGSLAADPRHDRLRGGKYVPRGGGAGTLAGWAERPPDRRPV